MVAIYRVDFPAGALGVELGPSRFDEVISRPDVFAAIPAPRYGEDGPELLLRDLVARTQIASRKPSDGLVFCVDAQGTTARRGGAPTRGCRTAVQLEEPLVEAGANTAREALDYTARTALVLRRDGGLTFAASRGATSREFARDIIEATDTSWAGVTSSGNGVALATSQGLLLGNPELVADAWLVARRPAVSPSAMIEHAPMPLASSGLYGPSESPPSTWFARRSGPDGAGNDDWLHIVAGVLLLAGAAWWYHEDRKR